MNRAPPSVGSVRRRGDSLQVRWRAAGKETSRSFASLADAEEFQRGLAARGAKGRDALMWGSQLSVAEMAMSWAQHRQFAERTLRTNETHLKNHILPVFGDVAVADLYRLDIETWLGSLPLAPKTKQRVLRILRQIVHHARDRGYIDSDPTVGLSVPGANQRRSLTLPTIDAVEELQECIDPRFAVAVDLMGYGGSSISELSAIKVGDLNFKDRVLTIQRCVDIDSRGRSYISDRMKTPTRLRRVLVVPEPVWERLEAHEDRDPKELVVGSPSGSILHPGNFRRRFFNPAVMATESCPDSLTPHGLRHFACSMWLAAGCSDYDVAAWAGHTDTSMVRSIYGHALPRSGSALEAETLASVQAQRSRPRTGR